MEDIRQCNKSRRKEDHIKIQGFIRVKKLRLRLSDFIKGIHIWKTQLSGLIGGE